MRVAATLRKQLLRSSEPTLRDREIAGLAAKVEARARAMSKAESKQRLALLRSALERPDIAARPPRRDVDHILQYLDDLNDSKPESMSYYAQEKMRDLVLDIGAESTDIRMLDSANLDLINGVVLDELLPSGVFRDEPAADSFAAQVVALRDPYPGETVFVDDEG